MELIGPGHEHQGVAVALSGGLDSTVLLHRLWSQRTPGLRALHVHHGLQPAADDFVRACEALCASLAVPLSVVRVSVVDDGRGLEAAAREARYAGLREQLRAGEALATAHHRDDQVETVLLRLLRGSGPRGLGGMRAWRTFAPGFLWRPLLDTPRADLLAHAQSHSLAWVEDGHNADPRFARSHLRSTVMPLLVGRWPAAGETIARAAVLQRESAALLDVLADQDLAGLGDVTLSIVALRALDPVRRRNALRRWVEGRGVPAPYRDTLLRVDTEIFDAAIDATPLLAWPGGELRRYRDVLFCSAPLWPPPESSRAAWNGEGFFELPIGCGELRGSGLGDVEVCVPSPVARFRPAGAAQRRTLKNLFQERGIPPWVRERTPVLLRDGEPVWVGGIGWAEGASVGSIDWSGRGVQS